MLSAGKIGFEDRGTGAPLVLLQAFPFSRRLWADLVGPLAARQRVLAVDAPGFGESPLATGGFTIAGFADALAALLDELKLPRATLLGVSLGGYTALAFAARHPDRLAALVLADTKAGADSAEARAGRETAIASIRHAGSDPYLAGSLPRLLSPAAPAARVAFLRAQAEARAPHLIAGIEALRDRPDRTAELPAIRVPTLVIRGAHDQVTPEADMKRLAAGVPGATFVSLPDAGHLAYVEAPDAFMQALVPFLAANAGGAA